jgi:hypothetical protein
MERVSSVKTAGVDSSGLLVELSDLKFARIATLASGIGIRTMNRRSFLSAAGISIATGLSGCVSNGRVVNERQESVLVPAGRGETTKISQVDGKGAIQYGVTADRRFDVYYFTSRDQYEYYLRYVSGQKLEDPPAGHGKLTETAVYNEETEEYEVEVPSDGGRQSISVNDTHYFVVDHSSYGQGVPVDEHDDPLQAFISLKVIDKQFPI